MISIIPMMHYSSLMEQCLKYCFDIHISHIKIIVYCATMLTVINMICYNSSKILTNFSLVNEVITNEFLCLYYMDNSRNMFLFYG